MPVSSHFASRRVAAALSSTTLSIAVATLLVACSGEKPGGPPPGFGGPPPPVAVLAVQPQTVPVTLEYTGQTQGAKEVEVRARTSGILLKRNFREGTAVSRGQSLYSLDPAPLKAALDRADADVAAAEARLGQATRTQARLKPLYEAKAVSQKDFDDAVSAEPLPAPTSRARRPAAPKPR
jgi:membrane fusion protein (multidrug efflux system)